MAAGVGGGAASAAPVTGSAGSADDYYINYAAPQVERAIGKDQRVGSKDKAKQTTIEHAELIDRKHAGGNPKAARKLAQDEAKAIKAGKNPRQIKQAKARQEAKLLTILVEFNENARDNFSGVYVPKTVFGDRTCVRNPRGTRLSGPLHNKIPNPATYPALDNNTFWVPDFSPAHFDKMLYSTTGITDRVRPDLTGPDGKPGINIAGYTMRNMYEEMSKGAYTVTGKTTNWVKVDHSEAWYGADTCTRNAEGEWEAGAVQDMNGHPSNPGGPATLATDAVAELAAAQPTFPFKDYDIEDQGDVDGDGNVYEPDGVIDHVVLVHAGEDKSGGGGAEGTYAIWAHSSSIPGGAVIPGTDGLKVANYIVQPEDSGVGVFAHEYGHDLGLPDLYDTSSGGDSDVDFWDLMSSGSHSGPVFQSMPTHMGIWDKWVLGWADPQIINPGSNGRSIQLGQTSRTPRGTKDGIRVSLPDKVVTIAEPLTGTDMWWSGNDQDWAKNSLTRTLDVPATGTSTFEMQNNYVIEEDWDFGFVEVSTDGGATWEEQPVKNEAGETVSTPLDYPDPNNRLHDYGDKKFGLTGDTHGWQKHLVDLTPFAGDTIQLRLLYATDAAFVERGWFADSFALTNGTTVVWSDPVEGAANGWTATVDTFVPGTPLGAGWRLDTGTQVKTHYYLAEWRNFDGFDEGLKYAYDTTYSSNGPWKVEKIAYNAPGMLVWYRDTTYGNQNPVLATTFDLPSTGTKGGLLIVDSHFDPMRRTGVAADKDPSTLNNMPSRAQSSNAAFNTFGTYPFKECLAEVPEEDPYKEYCTSVGKLPAVKAFTDAKTWYPGIEYRGDDGFFFRDIDASVVVPSRGVQTYSTRIVDANGNLIPDFFGGDLGLGSLLGTGNPADGNFDPEDGAENLSMGVQFAIKNVAKNNTYATVTVTPMKNP